jgi:hypothetical protein
MADYKQITDLLLDKKGYADVSTKDKNSAFFMIQRRMSAAFLQQTQKFNTVLVNYSNVMDFWHVWMCNNFSRKPGFYFVYPNKNSPNIPKKLNFDKEILGKIVKAYELDSSDIKYLCEFHPDEIKNYAKKLESLDKIEEKKSKKL